MQFSCDQSELYTKLTTTSKAVTNKSPHPILKGILISTAGSYIELRASDMEISIYSRCEAKIAEEGATVVMARKFVDIVKYLPPGDINFSMDEKKKIHITGGNTKYTIQGIDPDEFPEVFTEIQGDSIEIDSDILASMINKTNFAASTDEARGIITGELISIKDNLITMVALDGFRMGVVREPINTSINKTAVIHARILKELSRILMVEEEKVAKFTISDKQAFLEIGTTKIYCRLLTGEFIKYEDLLPKENSINMVVDVDSFKLSLERTSPIVNEGKSIFLKFEIKDTKLIISSRASEGEMQDEIDVVKSGEDLEIGFNHRFLYEILNNISASSINMEFNTAVSPSIIRSINATDFEYLILPVRLTK